MCQVNFYLLNAALTPLTIAVLQDEITIDPDDESQLRTLFRERIRPYIARWAQVYRSRLQLSLAYYIHRPETLDRVLASEQDLDMPEPTNVVRFFAILWEVLYPNIDCSAIDLSEAEENNDTLNVEFEQKRESLVVDPETLIRGDGNPD